MKLASNEITHIIREREVESTVVHYFTQKLIAGQAANGSSVYETVRTMARL